MAARDVRRAVFDRYAEQVIINPYRHGGVAPPGGGLSVTHTGTGQFTTSLAEYTFPSMSLGTAAADRHILVATHTRALRESTVRLTDSSGTAFTQVARTASQFEVSFHLLPLATGTTSDIWVGYAGGSVYDCAIGVWAVYGLASGWLLEDSSSVTRNFASSPSTVTVTSPSGDSLVMFAITSGTSTSGTITWDNTPDYNNRIDHMPYGGRAFVASSAGSHSETFTLANALAHGILGAVVQ